MKSDLFQSCGHCRVFQIYWNIECSTFTAPSLKIWNSSTGIPSPPLALFLVMLPKAHLTSHSRMSASRWVITPSWLSGSWGSFLYSSVYYCHLFLISSASVRSIPFLSFIEPIFAWNVPLVRSIPFLSFIKPIFGCSSEPHKDDTDAIHSMCVLSCFGHVRLFVTPWTVAHQAALSMGFLRQEYWSGLSCPPPRDLPDPRIELASPGADRKSVV